MNGRPKLILLGGFLGSGKTTLMLELARRLGEAGLRVGVITNDQGELLVDTMFATSAGLAAGEVQNGCFCCNFTTFVANMDRIIREVEPDYVIAEPVGSCTDLVATVVTPLTLYHKGLVELAAYLVLADAPRIVGEYRSLNLENPLTPREVLVSHQIRESGNLVLSKIDAVSQTERDAASALLARLNPSATITSCSARTGEGMAAVAELATSGRAAVVPPPLDIDYETYAAAEAEMGWYNGRAELVADGPDSAVDDAGIDPEALAMDLAMSLSRRIGSDLIHGKVLVTTETGSIKVSVVGGVLQADVSREGDHRARRVGLTVNLRATVPPDELADLASQTITKTAGDRVRVTNYDFRSLTPGTPIPEHRITDARSPGRAETADTDPGRTG